MCACSSEVCLDETPKCKFRSVDLRTQLIWELASTWVLILRVGTTYLVLGFKPAACAWEIITLPTEPLPQALWEVFKNVSYVSLFCDSTISFPGYSGHLRVLLESLLLPVIRRNTFQLADVFPGSSKGHRSFLGFLKIVLISGYLLRLMVWFLSYVQAWTICTFLSLSFSWNISPHPCKVAQSQSESLSPSLLPSPSPLPPLSLFVCWGIPCITSKFEFLHYLPKTLGHILHQNAPFLVSESKLLGIDWCFRKGLYHFFLSSVECPWYISQGRQWPRLVTFPSQSYPANLLSRIHC